MTATDNVIEAIDASLKKAKPSYLLWLAALVCLFAILFSGLSHTIKRQSEAIEVQHEIISTQRQTIDAETAAVEYKFAMGFLAGCGSPCVIHYNPGGGLRDYEWLASVVKVRQQTVVIDGICASACALFADHARSFVKITDRAVFEFHQASDGSEPPQSPDIASWVKAHGGFPSQASGELTAMNFDDARRFWRPKINWYREPRRIDAPWHWPDDPMGFRERTAEVSVLPETKKVTVLLTPYEWFRETVE